MAVRVPKELKDAKGMGALAQGLTILPYLTHIYTPPHACRHAQNSAKDFSLPKFGLRGIVSSWLARLQNSLAWPTFGKAQAHAFCKKSFHLVLWTRSCSATFLQNKSPLNHVDSSWPCLDHTWTINASKKWNCLKQSIALPPACTLTHWYGDVRSSEHGQSLLQPHQRQISRQILWRAYAQSVTKETNSSNEKNNGQNRSKRCASDILSDWVLDRVHAWENTLQSRILFDQSLGGICFRIRPASSFFEWFRSQEIDHSCPALRHADVRSCHHVIRKYHVPAQRIIHDLGEFCLGKPADTRPPVPTLIPIR